MDLYIILSKETSYVLQCEDNTTRHSLKGSEIIILKSNCKLYSEFNTLATSESRNISHLIIMPDITTDNCYKEYTQLKSPNILPLNLNQIHLDSPKSTKAKLERIFQTNKEHRRYNVPKQISIEHQLDVYLSRSYSFI